MGNHYLVLLIPIDVMVILTDMVMVKVRLIPIKDVILLLYVDSVLYLIHVSKEVEIDMRL